MTKDKISEELLKLHSVVYCLKTPQSRKVYYKNVETAISWVVDNFHDEEDERWNFLNGSMSFLCKSWRNNFMDRKLDAETRIGGTLLCALSLAQSKTNPLDAKPALESNHLSA